MKKRLFLSLFLLALIHSSLTFAKGEKRGKTGGWRESYGGDTTISAFQNTAYDILATLKSSNRHLDINLKLLEDKIANTVLSCEKNLSLDGIKKDAINYPFQAPPRIALDCESWNSSSKVQSAKIRLVIHEYLHLMLIDDSDYSISSELTKIFYEAQRSTLEDSADLLQAALECNIPIYNSLLENGANIYYVHDQTANTLSFAIIGGCAPITKELIEYLPILEDKFDTFNIKPLVHNNENITIANLFLDVVIEARQTAIDPSLPSPYLNTLTIILKKYPHFKSTKVDYDKECLKSSSLLSALTRGVKVEFPKKIENVINVPAIKKLIEIGFSLDEADACGETPRSLLKKNNIVLKK